MSSIYYNKNKEKIVNIKSLLLKGSNINLKNKTRNKKITNLDKLIHSLENDLSERSEYSKSKLSLINKTNFGNTTTGGREIPQINRIPKSKKVIYVNNSKNSLSLSKEKKNKTKDLSLKKNKLISVKKFENIHINKNILKIYKNQCKTQRPLSTVSDIKLKKIKLFGNKDKDKDKNAKNKFININKNNKNKCDLTHNRNYNSNNILSNNYNIISDNNCHNLTQRNNFNKNKNILLSLKHKLKERLLNTSRNTNIKRDAKQLTDGFLNKSIYIKKSFNNNNSKEEEKASINNTCDDGDISINKSNCNFYSNNTFNTFNSSNYNKICASSIIKPTKKLVNKTLPDRDKILDSIHINKFNYEKYLLNKYKQKPSNTLYKIPLEMRKKIKNKLLNNPMCLIKNKKSSNSVDKNTMGAKIIKNNENKNNPKNTNININSKNIINKIKSNSNKLKFSLISKKESFNQNSLISPTTSITKENTISIKETITKKIMKIDSCTIAGYSSPGVQKTNQDNFFIINEFLGDEEQFFLGVCDGHGTYGHLVSKYITQILPDYLQDISDESIINSFNLTNKSLITNSKIDCSFSGSTCTTLIINLEKIICANLGDSRAVLAKYENGTYNAFNLSNDHKPNKSLEMKRILLNGGRIEPFYDEELHKYLGPERVWLKNSDIPGLAMTRSFGDNVAHSVGVISEPEIIKYEFNGNEKFIVLASDGIWEYIDSDECVNIVKDFYENDMDAIGALNALVKEAFNRWKSMEDSIDDITAIVIFFE